MSYSSYAQKAIDKEISIDIRNKTFIRVLWDIERDNDISFYFDPTTVPYFSYTQKIENKPLYAVLTELLNGALLRVVNIDEKSVALVPNSKANKAHITELVQAWKDGKYSYPFKTQVEKIQYKIGDASLSQKSNYNITINLIDALNKEPIIGATLSSQANIKNGTITDYDGKAIINVPSGNSEWTIAYLGFQDYLISLESYRDTMINLTMQSSDLLLDEVEISAQKQQAQKTQTVAGVESLEVKRLESITQALGEADIIKSLEVFPGVKSMGEVSSGFNVRGGNIDENLVLFNDAVIINPTHILGLTSVFNPDLIDKITLSKAYMDPKYGGWNSAVLDVKGNHGNDAKWKGTAAIGTTLGKISMDGPISKNITMSLGIRKSFSDWMLGASTNKALSDSRADFYDYNINSRIHLSKRHFLLMSHLRSYDNFNYNKELGYKWTNNTFSSSISSIWNEKFTSKVTFAHSAYSNSQSNLTPPTLYNLTNGITVNNITLHFTYKLSEKLNLNFGSNAILFNIGNEQLDATSSTSSIISNSIAKGDNLTIAPYFQVTYDLHKNLSIEGGIRNSHYLVLGTRDLYTYNNESQNYSKETQIGFAPSTTTTALNNFIEPRLNINYKINGTNTLKLSYNKSSQSLHLLTNGNTSLPSDIWIGSNEYIKPRTSTQYAVGLAQQWFEKKLSVSTDVYYKQFTDAVFLKDFPKIVQNPHLETEILQGIGRSYGFELGLEYNADRFNGSLAYTYARSFIQNTNTTFVINDNQEFNADNDIPHQLNVLLNYKPNPIMRINANFIYKNGRPFTAPTQVINVDGFIIPIYSDRNSLRIPDYARLDVGATIDFRKVKNKGLRHSFTLGIYNILGRRNPLNVFFRKSEFGDTRGYKLSLIGAAIPNLSWNMVF
jgi:hypothetical protein